MPLCEDTRMLKERLEAVMKATKITRIQKLASLAVTAVLTGSLLILGGFASDAQEPERQIQTDSDITDGWLNDSKNPESKKWRHSFKTEGFFVNQYGIRLAWNNDSSLHQTTRQVTAGEVYTVSFIEELKQYADNPDVMEAIRLAILEERETEENSTNQWVTNFIMTNPVVVGVDGPYQETYDELAAVFYESGKKEYYSSVLEKSSKETQAAMAERAYKEHHIPCFSMTVQILTAEERLQYLEKSYQDNQTAFFSILFSDLAGNEQTSYAYRAYEDDRKDFFSIAVESLDSYQCEALAKRAYREGKKEFLYLIPGAKDDKDF